MTPKTESVETPEVDRRLLQDKILDTLREGLLVLEVPDLLILNVNRSFLSAFKLEESDLVGHTCADIYRRLGRPKLLADMPDLVHRTTTTGRISHREYLATDLRQSPTYLDLVVHPIDKLRGQVRQVLLLIRDITRHKRSDTTLKRRVQKLSSLNKIHEALQSTMQLPEVLHTLLVGVTAGKGLGFNRAFVLLVDESSGMLKGHMALGPSDPREAGEIWEKIRKSPMTFSELLKSYVSVPGDQNDKVRRISRSLQLPLQSADNLLVRSLLEKQVMLVTKGRIKGRPEIGVDTKLVQLLETDSFVVLPLFTQQKSLGVLLADNFITHRTMTYEDLEFMKVLTHHASYAIENAVLYRELEKRIRDVENAHADLQEKQMALIEAERLSTIGKMAASVAHEIRNPLVTIGGYARYLLADVSPDDSKWEELHLIASEVSRLEFIVNEVLGYARYAQPHLRSMDLNDLVRQTLETFHTDWTFDNVCVDTRLDPRLPRVRADEGQLKQVLVNLLLNALQAIPNGGRVLVTTGTSSHRVRLEVADTGDGIPEHLREKVFTPFFTTKSSGIGLGLSIATQIIAAHGGDIGFESAEGQGTVFQITLPRAEGNQQS